MFERIILIVDDNVRVESIYIPSYLERIKELQKCNPKWGDYRFNLIHKASMKDALEYLSDNKNYVDVLVVDYDFCGEDTFTSGTAFVEHIREKFNRYCQIIFYTMQELGSIDNEEWIQLINSDVFKFVDKCDDASKMGEVLFEAATHRNPVVESLEQFFKHYRTMLKTYNYTLGGQDVTFDEIINHIRMDDEQGRIFIEKLLRKAILLDVNIEG